jgi:hypothetical protein
VKGPVAVPSSSSLRSPAGRLTLLGLAWHKAEESEGEILWALGFPGM